MSAMPAAVALAVLEERDQDLLELAHFNEFDKEMFNSRCHTFWLKWREDELDVSAKRVIETLERCEPLLPLPGCFIVIQLYTNQCFTEGVLGITDKGNAGIITILDCKARMEARQGKFCCDGRRLDTWIAYAISAEEHASCKEVFERQRPRLETKVQQFWTEQDMDGMQEYLWATDESCDCIRNSEGSPGMGLGEDEPEFEASANVLSAADLALLRALTSGEGVQLV